jgi:predicted metalloenzyme YecM/phosphoglycolate phosphatase-like HAD superfamily hydrolase
MKKTSFSSTAAVHPLDLKTLKLDGELFLKNLLNELESLGLSVTSMKVDHICFRVETASQYEEYKTLFSSAGLLLAEASVNGRPIATFRMNEAFCIGERVVELLELPAPKEGVEYATGFEHAEFIIKESFDEFSERHRHLQFKKSGNRNTNPELCLRTKLGQVKFHHVPLDRIIEIEKAKIKDIIFDFDGTLIRSRDTIYEINRIVFSQILGREVTVEESKKKFYPSFEKLFLAFEIESAQQKQMAVSLWSEVSKRFSYEVFEGVPELLRRLSSRFNLHLWTARDEASACAILEQHGLETLFTTMSFATDVESKPHQGNLQFDWLRADSNTTVMIGDSPVDMIGAKNVRSIAAAALWDPGAHPSSLISSEAELFFYTLDEFEYWLYP